MNAGGGFHSNDARGTTITQTPGSGPDANLPAQKVTPLVRTEGYEVGARTAIVPNLKSSLTFFRLDFNSELVFQGDAGTTQAGRPSRRLGFEFINEYNPLPWLTLAAEFAWAQARFTGPDADPTVHGDHIPGAVEGVGTFRVTVDRGNWFGSAQLRYIGPYALIENNTERAQATTLVNAQAGLPGQQEGQRRPRRVEPFQREGRQHRILLYVPPAGGAGRRGERHPLPSGRAPHVPAEHDLLFLKETRTWTTFTTR